MWLRNHAICTRTYQPVKTLQKLHPTALNAERNTATYHPKQCLGTAGNYKVLGKQRGCISQLIRKGKEMVYAITVTVRQATDSQPRKAQLQPHAEWRELKAGETLLLPVGKWHHQRHYWRGLKGQDWMSAGTGRFHLRKTKLERSD